MTDTISKEDLFRAVLALDVYRRGYNSGLNLGETGQIGDATIGRSSGYEENGQVGALIGNIDHETIGFFAQEYTLSDGTKIIGYRGTDDDFTLPSLALADPFAPGPWTDMENGFGIGVGSPIGPQALAALEFNNSIGAARSMCQAVGGVSVA